MSRLTLKVIERAGGYYCALLGHFLYRPAKFIPGSKRSRTDFERWVRSTDPNFDVAYVEAQQKGKEESNG